MEGVVAASGVPHRCYGSPINPGPVGYTLSIQQPGETPASEPWFLLLPPYKTPLVAFAVAAVPVLAVLLRAFKKRECR
jgi:hypothetical protein